MFLMGVNDILTGNIKTLDKYQQSASTVVRQLHDANIKVYLGTILPFKGYKAANLVGTDTLDPDKETLRTQINGWLRTASGADGIVDFDKALADPADSPRLNAAYQSDWLHPNDAGYEKMAHVAATVLKQ